MRSDRDKICHTGDIYTTVGDGCIDGVVGSTDLDTRIVGTHTEDLIQEAAWRPSHDLQASLSQYEHSSGGRLYAKILMSVKAVSCYFEASVSAAMMILPMQNSVLMQTEAYRRKFQMKSKRSFIICTDVWNWRHCWADKS